MRASSWPSQCVFAVIDDPTCSTTHSAIETPEMDIKVVPPIRLSLYNETQR